ncbi:MAG: glycosyltransferase family 39 protein [Gemmatimonadales bacterium]
MSRERRSLALIAAGALAARLILLLARGDYIVYDEGYYLLLARSLRAGTGFALNGLPHVALSPLQPVLVALASAAGVPDLWASRLLAALCGALLVLPVGALARRAGGERAVLPAAVLTAASPALMSFVPFFPGRSWNLYFGSEPLFLLLAFGAVACAVRAESGSWRWSLAGGVLTALAYLTRFEGALLAGVLLVVLAVRLALRRESAAAWRRLALGAAAGALVASPYLGYLHRELGRWALSGRVQAATAPGAGESPSAVEGARSGGQVLSAFVWQGEPDAFLRALYGLDAAGTRMASQYWGVQGSSPPTPATPVPTAGARQPSDSARVPSASVHRGALRVWWEGINAVMPWWLLAIALVGLALGARPALVWIFTLAVCATVPSVLTYVEPRSLLPLAPLAAIYAGVALARVRERAPSRMAAPATVALPGLVALALAWPAVRDGVQAWPQATPLQQVASARRTVGEYLAQHLPPDATVMSWHPAIAIWARRDWRVLPYESFDRVAAYAVRERAAAIVFSRFEPSPIPQPPRAFTVVLPAAVPSAGARIQLQPVDETPLLFVGRMVAPAAR